MINAGTTFLAMHLLLLLNTAFPFLCQAQIQGAVKDEMGKGIPYAKLKFKNKYGGVYSDSIGRYRLLNGAIGDTIIASCVGYRPDTTVYQQMKDSALIILAHLPQVLSEIKITADYSDKIRIGGAKKARSIQELGIGTSIARFFTHPNPHKSFKIISITVPYYDKLKSQRLMKSELGTSLVQLYLYRKSDKMGIPGVGLLQKRYTREINFKDSIKFDISVENIILPRDGVYVTIEWIRIKNGNGSLYNDANGPSYFPVLDNEKSCETWWDFGFVGAGWVPLDRLRSSSWRGKQSFNADFRIEVVEIK
jgi:hypothetical protein